jgi:hypothetical protein
MVDRWPTAMAFLEHVSTLAAVLDVNAVKREVLKLLANERCSIGPVIVERMLQQALDA